MVDGSGMCYVCVFFHMCVNGCGPLVWHGVGGCKGDLDMAGLFAVKLQFGKFPL